MEITILILVVALLFSGFILLTVREVRHGSRLLFPDARAELDAAVSRFLLVVTHEDFGSYTRHAVMTVAGRVAHDIAHVFLVVVRMVERLLTRLVRRLRDRKTPPFTESRASSTFIRHISEFKQSLRLRREANAETSAPNPPSVE